MAADDVTLDALRQRVTDIDRQLISGRGEKARPARRSLREACDGLSDP